MLRGSSDLAAKCPHGAGPSTSLPAIPDGTKPMDSSSRKGDMASLRRLQSVGGAGLFTKRNASRRRLWGTLPKLSQDLAHEECFGKPRRRVALDAAQPQQRPERLLVKPLSPGLGWKHLEQTPDLVLADFL